MSQATLPDLLVPPRPLRGFWSRLRSKVLRPVSGLGLSQKAVPASNRSVLGTNPIIDPLGVAAHRPAPAQHTPLTSERLFAPVREGLGQVPPLPHVVRELLCELSDPESNARSVARIAASDPTLAASLIRTVNAAAFGMRRKITSITEAVSYLGYGVVRSLVVRMRLEQVLPRRGNGAGYNVEDLWIHSMAVSHAADCLAAQLPGVDRAFVATLGLLHDIGKLAINTQFPNSAARLHQRDPELTGETFLERERQLLGADHAEIGAILAAHWKLPNDLEQAIRWHHVPQHAPASLAPDIRRATMVVHIANQLTKYCYVYGEDVEIDIITESMLRSLGLAPSLTQLLTRPVRQAISRAIFFAEESSTRPLDAIRRFMRFSRADEARSIMRVPLGNQVPRIEYADERKLDQLFNSGRRHVHHGSAGEDASPHICFSGWTSQSGIKTLTEAVVFHQAALSLEETARLPARFLIKRLLANLVTPVGSSQPLEIAQSHDQGRLWLAVRSPALRMGVRLGHDIWSTDALRILDREMANVLNLQWFEQVQASRSTDTLLFISHVGRG